MHAYIHTYIHTYVHTYIHVHVYIHIHPSIHPSIHGCLHAHAHPSMHIHITAITPDRRTRARTPKYARQCRSTLSGGRKATGCGGKIQRMPKPPRQCSSANSFKHATLLRAADFETTPTSFEEPKLVALPRLYRLGALGTDSGGMGIAEQPLTQHLNRTLNVRIPETP